MNNGNLHSLISLGEFKALWGVDERDEALARFVVTAATYSIEQYCGRRLAAKSCRDRWEFLGDHSFLLREYPVREVAEVRVNGEALGPEGYVTLPDAGEGEETWPGPYYLALVPGARLRRGDVITAVYRAGYEEGEVPGDLAAACFELAAWNWGRYRGKRLGVVSTAAAGGRAGEKFETAMPENVRFLLEPYRRKCL